MFNLLYLRRRAFSRFHLENPGVYFANEQLADFQGEKYHAVIANGVFYNEILPPVKDSFLWISLFIRVTL